VLNGALIVVGGLVTLAVAAGLVLGLADGSVTFYAFHVAAAPTFTVLGGLILPRRRGHPIGWLFVAVGLSSALMLLAGSFSSYRVIAWVQQWSLPIAPGLLPLVFLLFPNGHLPSRAWRPVVWATAAGLTVSVVALAWAGWRAPRVLLDLDTPAPTQVELALRAAAVGLLVVVLSSAAAVGSLVPRWRSADWETRHQVKALALGASTIPVGLVVDFFFGLPVVWLSLGVVVPAAVTAAILKYRLYDIDLVLNRSLVYATLTVLVIGAYGALVTMVAPLLGGPGGRASLTATVVVALLFQPARAQVQRGVNRLLYGDRDDPYAVVTRLSRQLEQATDPHTVLPRVARTVAEALQLPYAAIELTGGETVASYGRPGVEPVAFPMTHQGRTVGRLLAGPRSAGQPFTTAESRLLQDLAAHASLAAHTVRLTSDLQRSRERLIHSREEERRRLRRELHDGLGPALAGLIMQTGAARTLLPADAGKVDATLGELERQLQASVIEVRRIVDDLRPPVLEQLGLVGAIRARADTFLAPGTPRLQIAVDPQDLKELPAAVEVATYRIVTEAITNAVRHANAKRCDVRLTMATMMTLEVSDDGIGQPEDYQPGVGLASMRERAEELGGTFTLTRPATGGTRIRVELPLATP
jgi:two-component system NarL family sensor kinase